MGLLPADMWEITLAELFDIINEREIVMTNNCITTAWLTANYSRSKLKNLDHYLISGKAGKTSHEPSQEEKNRVMKKWGF